MAKKKNQAKTEPDVQNEELKTEEVPQEEAQEQEQEVELSEQDKIIAELESNLASTKEAFIRTLAEYDNYRKRSAKEKESTYNDAKSDCLTKLIPVLDNFERATSASESDFEGYQKGMQMIYNNFAETMKALGVVAFGEVGDEFDPNFHNGVMHVEDENLGENVISQVFSKGYKLGEKVLREAMVQVAN